MARKPRRKLHEEVPGLPSLSGGKAVFSFHGSINLNALGTTILILGSLFLAGIVLIGIFPIGRG